MINSSLGRSSFSVSDVTDEHNIYLGLSTKLLLARLSAIYSSYNIYSMFPRTYISRNYCCVTFFVSLFINLRHPRDFTSHIFRRRPLYRIIVGILRSITYYLVPGNWYIITWASTTTSEYTTLYTCPYTEHGTTFSIFW